MKTHWLRQLREQINITQEGLASRLQLEGIDVSRSSVASWESGRHEPPLQNPEFRQALARTLRISVKGLLQAAGYEVDESYSEWAARIASLVNQLSEDKQKLALRIVEQIAVD